MDGRNIRLRAVSVLAAFTILLLATSVSAKDAYSSVASRVKKLDRCPYAHVFQIGSSVRGRPIYAVAFMRASRFDNLPRELLISGQHGNEQIPVYASLRLMEDLSKGRAGLPAGIQEKAVIVFVPVVNPDGFAASRRCNAAGVDLNRNWDNPNQPESLAVTRLVDQLQPDVLIDQHEWTDEDPHRPNCLEAPAYPRNGGGRLARTLAELAVARSPLGMVSYRPQCNPRLAHRHFTNKGVGAILVETGPGWPRADRAQAYIDIMRTITTAISGRDKTIAAQIAGLPEPPKANPWLASVCADTEGTGGNMPLPTNWPALFFAGIGCLLAWSARARLPRRAPAGIEDIRSLRAYTMSDLIQSDLSAEEKLVLIQRRRLRPTDRSRSNSLTAAHQS